MQPVNEKSEETKIMEIEKEIGRAYIEVLNRLPDPMGNEIYKNSVIRGYMTLDRIRDDLRSSPEYKGFKKKVESGEWGVDIAHFDKLGHIEWVKKVDEGDAIKVVNKKWNKDGITFVTSWGVRCGIATYSSYLMKTINRQYARIHPEFGGSGDSGRGIIDVYAINAGMQWDKINGNLIHLQHEFGIMPKIINSDSPMLITFHSVTKDILKTMGDIESRINVVGYIVHFDEAKDYILSERKKAEERFIRIRTNEQLRKEKEVRDEILAGTRVGPKKVEIFVIPHGTRVIPNIERDKIRELLDFESLGIVSGEDVAFVFGFQSGNKNFGSLIEACKNVGIKIIVSGSVHECGYKANDINCGGKDGGKDGRKDGSVIFLNRYLDETETDLFALASDVLLFNYISQDHYSCSGALHRVIGSGKPCVVSNTNHFLDVREGFDGVLKFNGQLDLETKITEALDRRIELGDRAREYAEKTSWSNVGKEHLRIYSEFTDVIKLDEKV